jgi:uncharacterized membrane-anchored protein
MKMRAGNSGVVGAGPGMVPGRLAGVRWVLARWRLALIAFVALAQAGVLVYMVADRETLLANGRVIDLRVVPVDPRDFFRGDFVTLSYDISRVPRTLIEGDLRRGDRVYVRLAQQKGAWQAVAAGHSYAEAGRAGEGEIILKARVIYPASVLPVFGTGMMSLSYGIEKFFVPEGAGRDIEKEVRTKDVVAHVAVAADGTAALKGLTVAGSRYDMPPLF